MAIIAKPQPPSPAEEARVEETLAEEEEIAPEHLETRADFPAIAIAFCLGSGVVAVVLGIVLGLTLANK